MSNVRSASVIVSLAESSSSSSKPANPGSTSDGKHCECC